MAPAKRPRAQDDFNRSSSLICTDPIETIRED
jgi:hypothetical protein